MTDFLTFGPDGAIQNLCRSTLPPEWVLAHWALPPGGGIVVLPAPLDGPAEHYRVTDSALLLRDVMAPSVSATSIAADGEDACAIAGLPDPCTVAISGAVTAGPVEVVGGELVLTSTAPGAIHVRVTAGVQWRPWEVTIDAA